MDDRTHDDLNAKIRTIVDDAIADLFEIMGSRDQACVLMACQATIRIEDNEETKKVRQFVDESIWDFDDTEEPK